MKNKLNLKGVNSKLFYMFQGKLATVPIIKFIKTIGTDIEGTLVDFGCGEKPYMYFFPNVKKYIGIDKYNKNADLKEDIKNTSLKENSVDCILCNQVIEHEKEPEKIIIEAYRILRDEGRFLLSAPQMSRLHGEPHDYFRYTKYGLRYLLEKNGFKIKRIIEHGGFFRAMGSHFNFFIVEKFGKLKPIKLLLMITIIFFNNILFSLLDKLIYWNKDTLGYNVEAIKNRKNKHFSSTYIHKI